MKKIFFGSSLFLLALIQGFSMDIAPYSFEDLLGEHAPRCYPFTKEDLASLENIKSLFFKNQDPTELSSPKIPKTFHSIWVGPASFPEKSKIYLRKWQELHPEWKMKFWTDRSNRPIPIPGMQKCLISSLPNSILTPLIPLARNYGEQSDLIRYIILLNEGGVYIDHDILPVQSFDKISHQYDFFAYLETPLPLPKGTAPYVFRANNGLIGCKPHHPILHSTIHSIPELWHSTEATYPNDDPHSQLVRTLQRTFLPFTTAILLSIDQPGNCDILFPPCFGCPRYGFFLSHPKESLYKRSLIYAEHQHDSLWVNPNKKNRYPRKTLYLLLHFVIATSCYLYVRSRLKTLRQRASHT